MRPEVQPVLRVAFIVDLKCYNSIMIDIHCPFQVLLENKNTWTRLKMIDMTLGTCERKREKVIYVITGYPAATFNARNIVQVSQLVELHLCNKLNSIFMSYSTKEACIFVID